MSESALKYLFPYIIAHSCYIFLCGEQQARSEQEKVGLDLFM